MDWSHPLPDPWEGRFLMVCDAVAAGRLNATPGPGGKERWGRICLLNVWRFLADHGTGEEWAWLWETCQDWSQRCGRELTADAEGGHVGHRQDEDRPSFVGRPSKMEAILREMRRRSKEYILCPTLAAEARALHQWGKEKFPDDQIPKELSMQNAIRHEYRKLRVCNPI